MLVRVVRLLIPTAMILAGLGVSRLLGSSAPTSSPVFPRRTPWVVTRYDRPRMVTDEQLKSVLVRLRPPPGWTDSNVLLHALRMWGLDARFADDSFHSGFDIQSFFLDDRAFQQLLGPDAPPLFSIDSVTGDVSARSWSRQGADRGSSSYHLNDVLATFAEIGTRLDTPIYTRDGVTSVERLLATAMEQVHYRQLEFEWSVISYARFVYPEEGWSNEYGERIDADSLVHKLIDEPLDHGPCNGLHRLEAMVVLWRADEALGPASSHREQRQRERRLERMLSHMQLLATSQSDAGYWTRQWPSGTPPKIDAPVSLADRILVTGHHLEWLALAPPELQVPEPILRRAAQWTARAIQEVDDETLLEYYGPFSHAGRALSLWRKEEPYQAWQRLTNGKSWKPEAPAK